MDHPYKERDGSEIPDPGNPQTTCPKCSFCICDFRRSFYSGPDLESISLSSGNPAESYSMEVFFLAAICSFLILGMCTNVADKYPYFNN